MSDMPEEIWMHVGTKTNALSCHFRPIDASSVLFFPAVRALNAEARIRALEAAAEKVHGIIAEYWGPCMGSVESLLTLREAVGERATTWLPKVSDLPRVTSLETACGECGGSGLTMQPGMPDGEPEGKPCPECKSKQFAPIGNGTICSNCTKTIGYHYQTAAGVLWCEVPKETKAEPTLICPKCGVDRYKQACRALTLDCPMHGETTGEQG